MIRLSTFLLLTIFCKMSYAICNISPRTPNFEVHLPEVLVQRDTPVGAILAEYTTTSAATTVATCQRTSVKNTVSATIGLNSPSSIPNVYNTNLPGIGVSVFVDATRINGYLSPIISYTWPNIGSNLSSVFRLNSYKVSLIKTGEVVPGQLSAGNLAYFYANDDIGTVGAPLSLTGTVKNVACSVKTTAVNISLGDILTSRFSGVGSTVGDRNFTLNLDCDPGTAINLTLQGNRNTDASDNSVLALSSTGDSQVADGVGVQILNDDVPLKINERISLRTATNTNEMLSLKARYIQTKNSIKTGLANSSATLSISYE